MRLFSAIALILILALSLPTAAAEKSPGVIGARYPHVSPDGKQLAFALHGDLWVMPIEGGRATRLSLNEANDVKPRWSPDGKQIAFTSDRGGNFDVWIMSADGGAPTQLTFWSGTDHVCDFTTDGQAVLFQSGRSGTSLIYRVPITGGTPVPLTLDSATYAVMSKTDGMLYYQRSVSDSKRKGYRGSANDDIYRCKPGEIPEQLTQNDQNDRLPHISPGRDEALLRARDREVGEGLQPARDGPGIQGASRHAAHQTRSERHELPDLQPGVHQGHLPLEVPVPLHRHGEAGRGAGSGSGQDHRGHPARVHVGTVPDEWRGLGGCEPRRPDHRPEPRGRHLDHELGRRQGPTPHPPPAPATRRPGSPPDGRWIAFYSTGRTGNPDIFVMDRSGGNLRQITFNERGDFFQTWSPDGKYLAFCSERSGNKDIWRVALDGSAPEQLTRTPYNDDDPCYSPDGQHIAYDSWPDGRADIYIMNADGTGARKVYGSIAQEESPPLQPRRPDDRLRAHGPVRNAPGPARWSSPTSPAPERSSSAQAPAASTRRTDARSSTSVRGDG